MQDGHNTKNRNPGHDTNPNQQKCPSSCGRGRLKDWSGCVAKLHTRLPCATLIINDLDLRFCLGFARTIGRVIQGRPWPCRITWYLTGMVLVRGLHRVSAFPMRPLFQAVRPPHQPKRRRNFRTCQPARADSRAHAVHHCNSVNLSKNLPPHHEVCPDAFWREAQPMSRF